MSEQNPQAPWLDAWMSMQQDVWKKLMSGQAGAMPPSMPGPAQFMQFFGVPLPDSSADVSRRMLEFGEGYLGVAREFWKLFQSAAPSGTATDAERLQRELEKLRASFTEGFARLYGAPFGEEVMAAWKRMGEAAAGAMGGSGAAPIPGLPPLGLTREKQEAMQRLGGAALRYQQALVRFGELLARVSGDAVDRLSRRVVKRASGEAPIGSLRAMYDLWVESGEEAFAAAAHGAEFAKAQAELNDALTELRAEQQKQVEEWARALDLPTRAELNSLIRRIDTLRNRVREIEGEIEALKQGRGT